MLTTPLYVKNCDLPNKQENDIALQLCELCTHVTPGQVIEAQLFKGIWSIYMRSQRARNHLSTVKFLKTNNFPIELHDTYPIAKSVPDEKIVFKDLPMCLSDKNILDFIDTQPGLIAKSGVIPGRLRDSAGRLTPFLSGERLVYVKGKFTQAMYTIATINNYKCHVWHKTQKNSCGRYRKMDHTTSQAEKCKAFLCEENVITVKSHQFVLCNYFPCRMRIFDNEFSSSEQAYQWRYLKYIGMDELAQEVLEASSAKEAMDIASRAPRDKHNNWNSIKVCVMREILHAKADSCEEFKSVLLDSSGKRLVEAVTGDTFWSSGLPPYLAASTNPQSFPGSNQLGVVLDSIRAYLMKEIVLSKLLGVDDDVPGSNSILKTVSDNELLLPSPLLQDIPTYTEVNQPVPSDTTLKPTPLSTKFSPPNPLSSVSPLPSTSSSPTPALPPTAHPSPIFSQTSSSIISAHKCPESEDVSLHSIAVTSEPNNQLEQQSTQPLKNTKKLRIKTKGSHPQHLFRTSIPMYLFRDQY